MEKDYYIVVPNINNNKLILPSKKSNELLRIHLLIYPFRFYDNNNIYRNCATLDVYPNKQIKNTLLKIANDMNKIHKIPYPRLELISVELNIWLDPNKTWHEFGMKKIR